MREENLAPLKRGYEAFANGDLDTIEGTSAPNEVWHKRQGSQALIPSTAGSMPCSVISRS